jgi:hypothetical protein
VRALDASIPCDANCLQPDRLNDNGWDQGLLLLNPAQVRLQPPGYVTQMFSRNYLPEVVKCEATGTKDTLNVTRCRQQRQQAQRHCSQAKSMEARDERGKGQLHLPVAFVHDHSLARTGNEMNNGLEMIGGDSLRRVGRCGVDVTEVSKSSALWSPRQIGAQT